MPSKVKILLPFASPGVSRDRFGMMDMVIPYTIDDTNRFEVRIPLENYTPEKGLQTVKDAVSKQLALYGKEFTI